MGLLGKDIRTNRLLHEDGKLLAVAVDQAPARGVFDELMPIERKIDEIVAGQPDAMTMHKGIADKCFQKHAGKSSLIFKASTFSPFQPNSDVQVANVQEAIRYGADAISMGCIVGGEDQPEQLENLATLAGEAHATGLPVVAHIYPRGNMLTDEDKKDWRNTAYAVRTGAELGVDIVKTKYTGDPDSFHKVVSSTPSKVVVAGGDIGNDIKDYFQMVHDVIEAGGTGITFGRIVWNRPDPTSVIKAFNHIIHDNGTVKEAIELHEQLSNGYRV